MIGQVERVYELNNLKRVSGKKKSGCPIVSFTSGKGGTGKSFTSLNLAYALARVNKKVLVVDLDANLSNINIMLNVKSEITLYHFFRDLALLEEIVYKYEPNLHFIFGDSGKLDHPEFGENNVEYLFEHLEELSQKYDYIFLDTAAGAGPDIISILSRCSFTVVVTTPEPTSIMDAYVILKLLSKQNPESEKHIIINKSSSLVEGKTSFENLNKASVHFLKQKLALLGIIEFGDEVGKSILNQNLLIKNNSESRIARQIKVLAGNFVKIKHVANNNQ